MLAGGTKVRGANLTVEPNTGSWDVLWSDWDWDGWIKPQIDRAASIDANVVRIIGSYDAVHDATMTEATYLDRWEQLAAYVNSLGMTLYPCGGGLISAVANTPPYFTDAFIIDLANKVLTRLAGYDLIGFDVVQEHLTWAETNGEAVARGIRAEHPTVPLTFSWAATDVAHPGRMTRYAGIARFVDFFDVHVYADIAADAFDPLFAAHQARPLLLGEFGEDVAAGQAAQEARYNAVKAALEHTAPGGQEAAGALLWAMADQGTADADKYGVFDNSGVERTYLTDIFALFPT